MLEIPSYPRYQPTNEPSPETKRILEEINRINVQLGYIKRPSEVRPRLSVDGYFYPRQPYHPLNQHYTQIGASSLQPSIRQIYPNVMRQVVEPKSMETATVHPFAADSYYYPAPYLQLPAENTARQFTDEKREHRQMSISNDVTNVFEYAPGFFEYMHESKKSRAQNLIEINKEKANLIKTVKNIVNDMKEGRSTQKPMDNAILINNKTTTEEALNIIVVSPFENIGQARGAVKNATHSKTFFKPSKAQKQPVAAVNSEVEQVLKPVSSETKATESESEEEEEFSKDPEPMSKGPFSSFFNSQKEQVVEALKQGGVIIQRLRVRNGGIAIAGPNGVATAGSGGTAIVGPGGIALTHPRSLAIVGPGARVIAVPESTDLQELALRSSARNLEQEGVLVATGPVVYYNPAV